MTLTVHLGHDHDCESPSDWDGWKTYSFSTNHTNHKHPNELDVSEGSELRAKLDSGLAFFLSYYEHGRCLWSLRGEGPSCQWDSVNEAGILVWEQDEANNGNVTLEDRRKDAQAFLDSWNAYVNGDCYYYSIIEGCETCGSHDKGEVLQSCGGFLGTEGSMEGMFYDIKEYVEDKAVKFTGEAKYLAECHWNA